ncbi:MAG: bifunctional 5,10-methylenetetrahydrofolate dehydrogenase/5,10-methenyltetrahydrofolate cyclohydrolase [Minisyncoccia bacterium]
MPQFISGKEIADIKETDHNIRVQNLKQKGIIPRLAIIQTTASSVIDMYIRVKKTYAEKIGVVVEHFTLEPDEVEKRIAELNENPLIHGIIVQLPLSKDLNQDSTLNLVTIQKDVDGLASGSPYVPPTVQSIMWLLDAYVSTLSQGKRIALVGRGRLVGAPLEKQLLKKNIVLTVFTKNDTLSSLVDYDVIVSATGTPSLLTNTLVKENAFVLDAGTAEEDGTIHGDAADELYERGDIFITPTKGGVGILTVRALFENVLHAAEESYKNVV